MIKTWDKSRVTSVQISLDIGTLTRYCTFTRMPSHVAATGRYFRCQTFMTSPEKVFPKNVKSEIYILKVAFYRYKRSENATIFIAI